MFGTGGTFAIFIQVKFSFSKLEGSRGKHKETVGGVEQPALVLNMCGIYTMTLIVFYCSDASLFITSSSLLS